MPHGAKTDAAVLIGAAVCTAAGSLSASADAVLDGDTLTLSGNVTRDEIWDYSMSQHLKRVVAEAGTVLPEDCSDLFHPVSDLTTLELDPQEPFEYLVSVDLSKADASHVTNMNSMFYYCSALKELNISSLDTSNVTDMSCMFYDCRELTELDLTGFDTSNVLYMSEPFYEMLLIESDNIDDIVFFDYYGMFENCRKLKTIYVSDLWNTDAVVQSEDMFYGCTALTGGSGTKYSSEHIDGDYAHIDGGMQNPGYLTFGGSTVKGASLSLDGRIGINFYVRLSSDAAKAVLEGPLGTVEIPRSEFAGLKVQNGEYAGCTKLTYGINATQRLNKVTLKLYDSGNNLTDIYKGNAVPLTDKQFLYSAADYIDSYQDTGNEYLTNLVTALERYFKSAENHFMGKTHTIFPEDYSHHWFDDCNTADGDYGLSLILNSGTDLRIYTDAAEVIWQTDFDEYETLTAETSADGKRYFAITDIPAQNLVGSERIYVDGREHLVCPRDWCVLAVADDKPQTVQDLGWALYEYGKAAETYLHSL
ncbi:MAG: BspA family leucine-rich repeat surface protein [Oscillospiraceae bacterium]|nr:BspA family leucine-rich repeat surface protein [Oscillospiraceae bacterium]